MTPQEFHIPYLLNQVFYKLAVTAWGDPALPPVICVHGLTRQGRDFDALAQHLARDFYVLCPDLPGRGRSDWLPNPADYTPTTYTVALSHLLALAGRQPVYWVGTSLGGLCGMILASLPQSPITRLVLNDIGPFIPQAGLARIRDYLRDLPDFADMDELTSYLERVHAPFGHLTPRQWQHLALYSSRPGDMGRVALHYDPKIAVPITAQEPQDADLWTIWDQIGAKIMVLRGETSDILLPETLDRMGARAQSHTVPDCGHAPALMDAPTIGLMAKFFDGDSSQS